MHITRRSLLRAAPLAAMLMGGCAGDSTSPNEGGVEVPETQRSFFCFDTACVIGGSMERGLLDAAVERCQGFERTLSRTIATSDVGRINAAAGAPVEVQEESAELIARSLEYSRASGGLFDITIGAVSELWDFHEGVVPTDEAISAALVHVGYEGVLVEGATVTLADPEARIDLGGIAKGYVADVLLDELEAEGVQSAYVNLGGNVKVLGAKPDGSPWVVGVRDPEGADGDATSVASVELVGGSVVTSGLYERQFERDGRRYWHILDPRTGYPVESDIVSATIVSERSIDGDGFTKPLFMLGREEALALVGEHGLQALLIDAGGNFLMSEGATFELL